MTTQPLTTTDGTQLDPKVLKVMSAIKSVESGGDYNATGDNGAARGAFQYNEQTGPGWGNLAQKHLGDAKAPMDKANQNKVTYMRIKEWKDQGRQPEEIAALWNGASKDTNTGKYIYNNPEYGNKFREALGRPTQQPLATPQPTEQVGQFKPLPKDEPGLGQDLQARIVAGGESVGKLGTGVSQLIQGKGKEGLMSLGSGALQTAGAVAGGLGDIVSEALERTPVIGQALKNIEDYLGEGVQNILETELGQEGVQKALEYFETHPETAKNLQAGFDIVAAIPLLKGLKVAGSAASDAVSVLSRNVAEKSFVEAGPSVIGNTIKAQRLINERPDVFKNMVDRRLVGDIKDGKFSTGGDMARSWTSIKNTNEGVNKILDDVYKDRIVVGAEDMNTITRNALNKFPDSDFTAEELLKNANQLTGSKMSKTWKKLESGDASLKEINKLRSELDSATKSVYNSVSEPPIKKEMGKALSDAMRTFIKDTAPETRALFDEMTTQFDIQKALALMNNKVVKPGGTASLVGHGVGIGTGGLIGGSFGGGTGALIGAYMGEQTARNLGKRLAGKNITQGVLKRTGQNARRTTAKDYAKGTTGLVAGSLLNRDEK